MLLTVLATLSPEAARWSDRLNRVQQLIKSFSGTWSEWEPVPGVTGLQLALAGSLLVATLIGALILGSASQRARRVTTLPEEPVKRSALRLAAADAASPALLAVAVLGVYAALCVLGFRLRDGADEVLLVLDWLKTAGLIAALFWFIFRAIGVVEFELTKWSTHTLRRWDNILVPVIVRALRLIVPVLGLLLAVSTVDLPEAWRGSLQTAGSLALIGFVGLVLCELIHTAERGIGAEYRIDVKDNLSTRKIQTQVRILARVMTAIVLTVMLACMLTVFAPVRALGHSILASAGVAGIVLGIAAQRTLGTFIAGIQIAFTQPIRLDDVVIVESEWGRVEEITLTYVVVAIWDKRRMVLPITYFIEKPFQNWTRSSSALLGTVFFYLDYTVPVGALRDELDRILEGNARWDGKVKVLQVTDVKERTVEIRVLASAVDSGTAFDLRCEIRERLLDFIRRAYPHALPTARLSVTSETGTAAQPP